jgi:hypothetical protein
MKYSADENLQTSYRTDACFSLSVREAGAKASCHKGKTADRGIQEAEDGETGRLEGQGVDLQQHGGQHLRSKLFANAFSGRWSLRFHPTHTLHR